MQFKHFVMLDAWHCKAGCNDNKHFTHHWYLVSQALERQWLQTYISFDFTHQKKTKLNFFFVPTVYAGKMTSFLVNNIFTLTEFPTAFQQFQQQTDISCYEQQTLCQIESVKKTEKKKKERKKNRG